VAGVCLVVNLPGSRGGVKDAIAVLQPLLVHAVEQVVGSDHATAPATPSPTMGSPIDPRGGASG
jgi:hypothetical protein